MKILMLSDANNPHTIKWARSLAERGLDITIFSLAAQRVDAYSGYPNIEVRSAGFGKDVIGARHDVRQLVYLKAVPAVRKAVRQTRPDILHAHYATSYGLLGALAGFHPYVLSVWGEDIYGFARVSPLHREMVRFNLSRADSVLSTSHVMAGETAKYTNKKIEVTPFGIRPDVFRPQEARGPFGPDDIVIGTIKGLEKQYGVEYLIRAFAILKKRRPALPLKLLLVGGGSLEAELKALSAELGIDADTVFTGRVNYDEVHKYHNMLAVYVAVSQIDSESFGVAVLEAGACGKPVVVSRVGGLPEVVEEGVTGFIVEPKDPVQTADAVERLVLDEGLRERMGRAGRERVLRLYDLDENVRQMIGIYSGLAGSGRRRGQAPGRELGKRPHTATSSSAGTGRRRAGPAPTVETARKRRQDWH